MRFGIIIANGTEEPLIRACVVARHTASLVSNVQDVHALLPSLDCVILTAKPGKTVVFDVVFPAPLNGSLLNHAIRSEVEKFIPCPIQSVYWGYRKLKQDGMSFRIFATEKSEVDSLYADLMKRSLKCDYFVPVQLLCRNSDSLTMEAGMEKTEWNNPLETVLNYLPEDAGLKDLNLDGIPVPQTLRPMRYKRWRIASNVLMGIAALLVCIVLTMRYRDFLQDVEQLNTLRDELRIAQRNALKKRNILQSDAELQRKIEGIGLFGKTILPVLQNLSAGLPKNMYITGYTQKQNTAEVSIYSTTDDQNFTRTLMESSMYKADLRKTVQPDSTETAYTVTLREITL